MTAPLSAPHAPGKLGDAIPVDLLLGFLDGVRRWVDGRRIELDGLDRAALAATNTDAFTPDLTLAMGLWQAIADRNVELQRVWDSGRVGVNERRELSRLIWGRLDTRTGTGLALSLVEALTLSDALSAQLRTRLSLDPLSAGVGERLRSVRAQVERCRDLAEQQPARRPDVERARARVDELTERAARGADVTGTLGPLESEAAALERDLIVAAARRRDLTRDHAAALVRKTGLEAREAPLHALAARCHDKIADAPRLAVPDVSNLGPVPSDRDALDAYLDRLDRVAAAFDHAEQAYGLPLAERDELRGQLQGYRAMALAAGRAEVPEVQAAWDAAHGVLWSAPCDLDRARQVVQTYRDLVRSTSTRDHAPPGTPEPSPERPAQSSTEPEPAATPNRASSPTSPDNLEPPE